ncbi:MAG: LodA/GoxA family CTQ-dependent oxidase [Xanthobacteraceae bacterium]|nr:LodA/GoxA family CTQ-dependent oxidase [Xanthobacteraceae bacterium]
MTDLNRRSALSLALAATAAAAAGNPAAAQDQKDARIDPASIDALRIYPPLGIARVGNAAEADAYVIGPEVTGGPPTLPDGSPARLVGDFRTENGEIKRQAARFRVYAHLKDGSVVEVTAASAQIEWRVAIANLKAGWYEFNQAMDLPRGLAREARQRNRGVSPPGGRAALDIVPKPRSIAGRNAAAVAFDDGAFWGRKVYLGELRTDTDGRLLFLGGRGVSGPFKPGMKPTTFANNEGWHDDVADGPVRAIVTFPGAKPIDAEAAYVAVTPPNFAPGVSGVVTMDDVVRETFRREGWIASSSSTSFTGDIWPIFDRLTGLQWVNHGLFMVHGHGSPLDARDADTIARLRDSSAGNLDWRRRVFEIFRDPGAGPDLHEPVVPQIYGDAFGEGPESPKDALTLLAVTSTQYAHLQRWLAGNVVDDWPGAPPVAPAFATLTPAEQIAHLERAALTDCLGGPFHPGIELTWTMRLARLWKRAYRLNVLATDRPARQSFGAALTPAVCIGPKGPYDGVAAGALTRFMGVPWQTDEASCNSSADYSPWTFLSMPTYWGARVPDQVLAAANYDRAAALDPKDSLVQAHKHFMLRVDWLRDVRETGYDERIAKMVEKWWELGMVLPVPDPPAHLPAGTRVEQGRREDRRHDAKRDLVRAVEGLSVPTTLALRREFKPLAEQGEAAPPLPPRQPFRQGEI